VAHPCYIDAVRIEKRDVRDVPEPRLSHTNLQMATAGTMLLGWNMVVVLVYNCAINSCNNPGHCRLKHEEPGVHQNTRSFIEPCTDRKKHGMYLT
jgi:hypothetical protein